MNGLRVLNERNISCLRVVTRTLNMDFFKDVCVHLFWQPLSNFRYRKTLTFTKIIDIDTITDLLCNRFIIMLSLQLCTLDRFVSPPPALTIDQNTMNCWFNGLSLQPQFTNTVSKCHKLAFGLLPCSLHSITWFFSFQASREY